MSAFAWLVGKAFASRHVHFPIFFRLCSRVTGLGVFLSYVHLGIHHTASPCPVLDTHLVPEFLGNEVDQTGPIQIGEDANIRIPSRRMGSFVPSVHC